MESRSKMTPKDFAYPNPFNQEFQILITQEREGPVDVRLFDMNGKLLKTIYRKAHLEVGQTTIKLDLIGIPAGTYFLELRKPGRSQTQKFIKM